MTQLDLPMAIPAPMARTRREWPVLRIPHPGLWVAIRRILPSGTAIEWLDEWDPRLTLSRSLIEHRVAAPLLEFVARAGVGGGVLWLHRLKWMDAGVKARLIEALEADYDSDVDWRPAESIPEDWYAL